MVETGTERAEHKTRAVPGVATFLAVPQEVQGPSDLEETPPPETTPSPLAVEVDIMGAGAVLITAGAGAGALLILVEFPMVQQVLEALPATVALLSVGDFSAGCILRYFIHPGLRL